MTEMVSIQNRLFPEPTLAPTEGMGINEDSRTGEGVGVGGLIVGMYLLSMVLRLNLDFHHPSMLCFPTVDTPAGWVYPRVSSILGKWDF